MFQSKIVAKNSLQPTAAPLIQAVTLKMEKKYYLFIYYNDLSKSNNESR